MWCCFRKRVNYNITPKKTFALCNPMSNITPALIGTHGTYINRDTVVQAFANHSLPLNVNIFPIFNRQHLHQSAVYVKRDSLWLNAEGNFVPATVKKITDSCISEDNSHSVLGEPNGIVLQSFVLSIQSDWNLQEDRSSLLIKYKAFSFLLCLLSIMTDTPKSGMVQHVVRSPNKEQGTEFYVQYEVG